MPFVPPTESEKYEACDSPQHDPPSHMVIRDGSVWQCPKCGHRMVIHTATGR